jgi:uncharacterized membrane protein YqjE
MRYALVGLAQVGLLSLVFMLWKTTLMPAVGLTGLAVWAAFFYWLTYRLEKRNQQQWLDEYERRFRRRT